jgi:hypothetical protein
MVCPSHERELPSRERFQSSAIWHAECSISFRAGPHGNTFRPRAGSSALVGGQRGTSHAESVRPRERQNRLEALWRSGRNGARAGNGNLDLDAPVGAKLARLVCLAYANGIKVVACEENAPETGAATVTFGSTGAAEFFLEIAQAEYPLVTYTREREPSDEEGGVAAAVHFPMQDIPRLTEEFANLW